jgi:hypothetical protein
MSTLGERISALRVERYRRSVEDQSWNFFAGRWWMRALVVGSVVSSWSYFLLSIAKWDKGFAYWGDGYAPWALLVMLICYFGLRKALVRIATAPAGSLDERDLELRNDAFRMAYLVIRRIGLAIVVLSSATLYVTGTLYRDYFFRTSSPSADFPKVDGPSLISDALVDLFDSNRGVWIVSAVLITLTYCAYSFPLVILGWRQSRKQTVRVSGVPEYEDFAEWSNAMKKVTKNYMVLMFTVLGGFVATILFTWGTFFLRNAQTEEVISYLTQWALGALAFWFLFVYAWSYLSMLRANHLYRATQSRHLIGARRANIAILVATPSLIAIATFLSEFTRTQMNAGGNYQLGMLLSVLLQFIYLAVFVAPAVSMVAASIARRKAPPVEQVAAAS